MRTLAIFVILTSFLASSCGPNFYSAYVLDVTPYNLEDVDEWRQTPEGVYINVPEKQSSLEFYRKVDSEVANLSNCLLNRGLREKPLDHDRIAVYIPDDWYTSACSPEQLIPSSVNYKLCEAKGLALDENCRGLMRPTKECPCVCNVRAAIVDRYVVCTTPNLKLFRAELARLVLYPKFNNPWKRPLNECLKVGKVHRTRKD